MSPRRQRRGRERVVGEGARHDVEQRRGVADRAGEHALVGSSPTGSRSGPLLMRPRAGLMPTRPVTLAGMRIEPPPSDPWPALASPAATAAAAPPLDPPALRVRSHGVRAGGATAGSV